MHISYFLAIFIITEASTIPINMNIPLEASNLDMSLPMDNPRQNLNDPLDQIPITKNTYTLPSNNLDISLTSMDKDSRYNPLRDHLSETPIRKNTYTLPSNNLDISLLPMDKDSRRNLDQIPITNMDTYTLEGSNNLDISTSEYIRQNASKDQRDIEQLLSVIGVQQDVIEEVVKMCGSRLEGTESDFYTCGIKTVTSFIVCMRYPKDRYKEPTEPAPFIKCFSEAFNVFWKCLLSKPSSAVPNIYVPEFDIQNI